MVTPRVRNLDILSPVTEIPCLRASPKVLIPQHFQPAEVLGEKIPGHGDTDSNKVDTYRPAVRFKGCKDCTDSLALQEAWTPLLPSSAHQPRARSRDHLRHQPRRSSPCLGRVSLKAPTHPGGATAGNHNLKASAAALNLRGVAVQTHAYTALLVLKTLQSI